MRGLLRRSLIVAFLVSALTTLALGLLCGQPDPPMLSTVTSDGGVGVYMPPPRSVLQDLLYIFTDPAALLNLAELLVMFFIPVFLGCVWLGLWQARRAGRRLSGPRGGK